MTDKEEDMDGSSKRYGDDWIGTGERDSCQPKAHFFLPNHPLTDTLGEIIPIYVVLVVSHADTIYGPQGFPVLLRMKKGKANQGCKSCWIGCYGRLKLWQIRENLFSRIANCSQLLPLLLLLLSYKLENVPRPERVCSAGFPFMWKFPRFPCSSK